MVPLVRRRLTVPPLVTAAAVVGGPFGLAVATPRSRRRDACLYALQMWAFAVIHELPNDDPERLLGRTRVGYPIACDSLLGLGTPPTLRLQRVLGRPLGSHVIVAGPVDWRSGRSGHQSAGTQGERRGG